MGEKLVIGPIDKGLKLNREPFFIDNDSFPVLQNAYQWRGRVKRKRGTSLLGRLTRFFNSASSAINPGSTSFNMSGGGAGNILTGFTTLQVNASLVPGSISLNDSTAGQTYTDDSLGNLNGSLGGTGTINYSTGAIVIIPAAGHTINNTTFKYYPSLPVLGLEDLILSGNQNPGTLAFDTTFSYNVTTTIPSSIYDVSFYKNLQTGTYAGYTQKTNWTPTTWNGPDYRQFWTINYQGALWTTNTINVPFLSSNIGMQFAGPTTTPTLTAAANVNPTTMTFTIVGNPLVVGDFVFANEFIGPDTTATQQTKLNFQTGYVTVAGNTFTVVFPNAVLAAGAYTPGILQYLTNRSNTAIDCLRWYDGDPTNQSTNPPSFSTGFGWVNFMPPISKSSFSIADLPAAQYYLVGAKIITTFKDRLLFIGPVVQSATSSAIYLQDTVIYSQNGTPYYTCSFAGDSTTPTNIASLLVPSNQTATPNAYFSDQTGFGGFITAGIDQAINTLTNNEDVLLMGFDEKQTRFVYTGNDIIPFAFYITNSEYGSKSQFSGITLDKGAITRGSRGYVLSSQTGSQRIDVPIPDEVFQINLSNNGTERFCAVRDFLSEWIYFTYPNDQVSYAYPNQTLLYNYRDDSWAVFNECYTTYGLFRESSQLTWATLPYKNWASWNAPWNTSVNNFEQPAVIGGNQQGFILIKQDATVNEDSTSEDSSLYIKSFSGNTVTSPNHCLNNGDYIIIDGCLGTVGANVNGKIFQVSQSTQNTFQLNPPKGGGTYLGNGTITRMYVPLVQTKQFPVGWQLARKTRLGPQQYLLTTTPLGQITLQIYLSQNSASPYNVSNNGSLIYSTVLYTCPESSNLGLTPANTNLQMIADPQSGTSPQQQIWHRLNTSLIGDTVQLGFTMSDDQMRAIALTTYAFAITGATKAYPCVLTCNNTFSAGQVIEITGVQGMTNLNGNIYEIISANATTVTINVNSTNFPNYTSGGTATAIYYPNQFSEIELHSIILDVQPSQLLA